MQLDRVTLLLKGVEADAHLEVRLDEVRAILRDAFNVVRKHPEIMACMHDPGLDPLPTRVAKEVDQTVGEIGGDRAEAEGEGGAATQVTPGDDEATGQLAPPVDQVADTVTEPEAPGVDPDTPGQSDSAEGHSSWRARLLSRRMTAVGSSRHLNGLCSR